jgi:hypothetical protein
MEHGLNDFKGTTSESMEYPIMTDEDLEFAKL